MRRFLLTPLLALGLLLSAVAPSAAITGGQPDGDGHPYGALLLVPGTTFCSGTLIDENVVLTAGHCTFGWDELGVRQVLVSFDSQAQVNEDWEPAGGTWYTARRWFTHPDYVDAEWPFTSDYGIVILQKAVVGIEPANLPTEGLVDELIGENGQTSYEFLDVGYGQDGVTTGGGGPTRNFSWTRKVATQNYSPSQGSVGTLDPQWLILQNSPSSQHGSGCGGDSGSGIFPNADPELGDTVVAVHTGGYRLGSDGSICGRITSLNHRIDVPGVLDWILGFVD